MDNQIYVGGPYLTPDQIEGLIAALEADGISVCSDAERWGGQCRCISHPEFSRGGRAIQPPAALRTIAERMIRRADEAA